jgi:NhaP-type Na+/H+ or K+/H+ antiporter
VDHLNLLVEVQWRFPISVMMFIFGISMGVVFLKGLECMDTANSGLSEFITGMQAASTVDPHALLYIILPPLLYESASAMDWHVVRKILPSAVILAVPGVILNTFITGFFVKAVVRVDGMMPYWRVCWLLSSILSATDPVAVVAALTVLGAPAKLSALVEGESLLNDGSAVVLAYVLIDWTSEAPEDAPQQEKYCTGDPPEPGCVIRYFCHVALGGAAIGVAAGLVVYVWIGWARRRHYPPLEVSVILVAVYGTFFLAEAVKTSGVLACVALGIFMTSNIKARLSHDARHDEHILFHQIGYACNQVTFLSAGIISARFMWTVSAGGSRDHTAFSGMAWLELFGLYIFIHISRAMVIAIFSPLLVRLGYGLTWKECTILVYGGLRGAVGLIVGLIVEHQDDIDPATRQMIAFHTSGIVLLTLLVNGQTIDSLYKRLDLYPINPFCQKHMQKVLAKLEVECQKGGIKKAAQDWFFVGCHFESIFRCVPSFQRISFNEACVPEPIEIEEVPKTLRSIEHDANTLNERTLSGNSDNASGSESRCSFQTMWAARKQAASEHFLEMISNASELHDQTDYLFKVASDQDNQLRYKAAQTDGKPGIYISSRPLAGPKGVLTSDEDYENSFEVKIKTIDQIDLIIGFITESDLVRDLEPSAENQVLGVAPYSIGLDCKTGTIVYHGPSSSGTVPSSVGPAGEGLTVSIRVTRKPHCEWEVSYWMEAEGNSAEGAEEEKGEIRIGTCSFGPFPPTELYPAVEFRPWQDALVSKTSGGSNVSRGLMSPVANLSNVISNMSNSLEKASGAISLVGGAAALAGAMAAKVVGAPDSPKPGAQCQKNAMSPRPGGSSDRVNDSEVPADSAKAASSADPKLDERVVSEEMPPPAFFPDGMDPDAADDDDDDPLMDPTPSMLKSAESYGTTGSTSSRKFKVQGLVFLNFEPQLATDSESINELFHVLFNTLQHKYHHFHEHGLIGDVPLAWLSESVGEAQDCANNEVGAMRGLKDNYSRKGLAKQVTAVNVAQLSSKIFNPFRSDSKKAAVVALFEPLVVEYQSLELNIGNESIWEKLPENMFRRLHWLEFSHMRAKIESLWAFIEAHEKIVSESPTLQRFPDLVRCIRRVVDEARCDLAILQEIKPRSHFFVKHLILLRFLLNNRLEKLQKYIHAGWLSDGDGSALKEAFHERLTQTEQFWPHIETTSPLQDS